MKTAAILLRVSTQKQELESQKNDLLPIVKSLGYEAPEEYIFGQKITGRDNVKKEDRQSIKELKEACNTGNIKAIFINEVSRLSRKASAGRNFVDEFNAMKIPIYFKDANLWTIDPITLEKNNNSLILGILFEIAEAELETLNARSLRGRKQKARENKVTGSYLRFGYKKGKDNTYEIDEKEASFINDICEKYATGNYSIRALTNYANTTGIKTRYKKNSKTGKYTTKGGLKKKTDSVIWTTQVIRSILTEKMYLGKRKFTDIVSDVPEIITEELFNRVQKQLKKNIHHISKAKHTHLLQRKLICGNCGSFYYGHYKERSNSYLCSAYTRTAINCGNTSLNYERAESIIWNFLINQTYFFKKISSDERDKLIKEQEDKREELIVLKEKYEELKSKEDIKVQNMINSISFGFSLEELAPQKKVIDKNIENYNSEIVKINNELLLVTKRIKNITNQALTKKALSSIESNRDLMKEKIDEIVDKIVVYKLDDFVALLQIHYLNEEYNILYRYRVPKDRYYYVEDGEATFNNPHNLPEEIKFLESKIPEFDVTSNNNSTFNETIFGGYSGLDLIKILEEHSQYRDYVRFEKQGVS